MKKKRKRGKEEKKEDTEEISKNMVDDLFKIGGDLVCKFLQKDKEYF